MIVALAFLLIQDLQLIYGINMELLYWAFIQRTTFRKGRTPQHVVVGKNHPDLYLALKEFQK